MNSDTHRRSKLRLFLQALNRGWPVPEVKRDEARRLSDAVLSDPDATGRERKVAELVRAALVGPS